MLSTADMVVQRRDGPRRLREIDDDDYCYCTAVCVAQFPLRHSRGSSHGHSRIARTAYAKHVYSDMMAESFRIWRQLERDARMQLYM